MIDPGSYRESLDRCAAALGYEELRERQRRAREDGRLLGVGFCCFAERTGYGTQAFAQRKMTMTPGDETARVRMDPRRRDGRDRHLRPRPAAPDDARPDRGRRTRHRPGRIEVIQGDTDPRRTAGARSRAAPRSSAAARPKRAAAMLAERLKRIGAHMLEAAPEDLELRDGAAVVRGSPEHAVSPRIARVAHLEVQRLPDGGAGARRHASFDPPGTFSNATHGVVVEIDPETGEVRIERYVVVEDCGVMINPMVVEGQVRGGVAQGIAAALYEELVTTTRRPAADDDPDGLPGPDRVEIPAIEIDHLETPCAFSETGAKGMGEGGTMGARGCIANAVTDAVAHLGIEVDRLPITPEPLVPGAASRRIGGAAMKEIHLSLHRQRHAPRGRGRVAAHAGRRAAPRPRLHGHAPRLRARDLRRLHRPGRRRAGAVLPRVRRAGRRVRGRDGGGPRRTATSSTRCRRRSRTTTGCSAASARRGSSCWRRRSCARTRTRRRRRCARRWPPTCAGARATRGSSRRCARRPTPRRPEWRRRGAARTTACFAGRATSSTTSTAPASCGCGSCGRPPPTRGCAASTTEAARALPGVHAVLTAEDLPELPPIPLRLGPFEERARPYLQPPLARDRGPLRRRAGGGGVRRGPVPRRGRRRARRDRVRGAAGRARRARRAADGPRCGQQRVHPAPRLRRRRRRVRTRRRTSSRSRSRSAATPRSRWRPAACSPSYDPGEDASPSGARPRCRTSTATPRRRARRAGRARVAEALRRRRRLRRARRVLPRGPPGAVAGAPARAAR